MRQRRSLVVVAAVVLGLPGALLFLGRSADGAEPLPDSRLGVRTAPLLLLSRADVQADLGLSPEQAADARRSIDALYAKASRLRGLSGESAVAARRAIDLEQQRWIEEHLNETQRIRIAQIDLQWEGASALISRPSMSEALGFNPKQIETLKGLAREAAQHRQQGEPAVQTQRRFALRALENLSEPQRKSWKAMLGKPFQPQLAVTPAR